MKDEVLARLGLARDNSSEFVRRREAESQDCGFGRIAQIPTFAVRFVLREGHRLPDDAPTLCPYADMKAARTNPPDSDVVGEILLPLGGGWRAVIRGPNLQRVADALAEAKLQLLREGGASQDGETVIEEIRIEQMISL